MLSGHSIAVLLTCEPGCGGAWDGEPMSPVRGLVIPLMMKSQRPLLR